MDSTVAVTGAGGFVGSEVVEMLKARGARVIALSRHPERNRASNVESRFFDPNGAPNPEAFAGADAVVHLAGESIGGRWTPEKKRAIARSRIDGTRTVVESLAKLNSRPSVLVAASAVGYYGDRSDEPLTETSSSGSGFLTEVCVGWEATAQTCEALGMRCVLMRSGIALGDGGALDAMKRPFLFGAGGPLGSGRQFVPWIHVRDLAALYCEAASNPALRGPINAVAPDYATSARFGQALGAAMARPSLAPAPAFALRLVLGEFAQTLLGSQLVIPGIALDCGFRWTYPQLESALMAIIRPSAGSTAVRKFHDELFVARPLEEVFAFFSDARNLAAITPPKLRFAIVEAPEEVRRGSIVRYRLRIHGVGVRWKTMISEYAPCERFADVQLHGPYALWRHEHVFRPVTGGVQLHDNVEYVLPLSPFGELGAAMVERDLRQIFAYRRTAIVHALANGGPGFHEPKP